MKLFDGLEKRDYYIKSVNLTVRANKRLEALGMIPGTKISILNKRKTAVIIMLRGSRFALGKAFAENIEVTL
jgi:ferrous iron transport protein A